MLVFNQLYQVILIKMSKTKKKNQNQTGNQGLVESQKRQILEQNFTIKRLQDRQAQMIRQNFDICHKRDELTKNYEELLQNKGIIIETHQNTIKQLRRLINELEIKNIDLQTMIRAKERQLKDQQQIKGKELEEYKKYHNSQIYRLESQLKEYNKYMSERDEVLEDRRDLKKKLDEQAAQSKKKLADLERQRVQSQDKIKDQMLNKITEMRANLLSLKKEQLSTTTRLAVLQNHQLTSQLQFQSKQTQKLLFQNQQMNKKINNLKKDLQVHKDVEEELAKRSHMARAVIKKLTDKITELESDQESSRKQKSSHQDNSQENFNSAEIVSSLDKSLQLTINKNNQLQITNETLLQQNEYLQNRLQFFQKKGDSLLHLLFTYYQQFIEPTNSQKPQEIDNNNFYDLKSMRKRKVQDWSSDQVNMVVTLLLNQLSKKLNKKSLNLPTLNKNKVMMIDDDQLPKISQSLVKSKINEDKIPIYEGKPNISEFGVSIGSKIVSSNLREWGRTVHAKSISHIRKLKV